MQLSLRAQLILMAVCFVVVAGWFILTMPMPPR